MIRALIVLVVVASALPACLGSDAPASLDNADGMAPPDLAVCEPDCAGRTCGDDGCGGTCGTCEGAAATCTDAGQCACEPDCAGKTCGDDGCGGSCGALGGACQGCFGPDPALCDGDGQCRAACCADCVGKACGDDGCGGSCGACDAGEACTGAGACACDADCTGKVCGGDGCGGTCGPLAGACPEGLGCSDGACVAGCVASCAGKVCGDDGCGGTCGALTGACGPGLRCEAGACVCAASCEGKVCGPDGCGGTCGPLGGACPSGGACGADGQCACAPSCAGKVCGPDGCGGVCGPLDGACEAGQACTAGGQCVCAPSCAGKACGDNGCGGSCGACDPGDTCNAGQCQCVAACDPGAACGDDGCGGSCGQCAGGDVCAGGLCVPPTAATYPLTIGDWSMAPGAETTKCVVKRLDNPTDIVVTSISTKLAKGSHHLIVYRSNATTEQTTPFNCTPFLDTLGGSAAPLMISQVPEETLTFPPGVGIKLQAGQMIRLEAHFFNYYPEAITAHGDVEFHTDGAEAVTDLADFLFYGKTSLSIPPGAYTSPWLYLDVPNGAKVFGITGHTHQYGTNVEARIAQGSGATGTQLYPGADPFDWAEAPLVTYAPPVEFGPGTGFKLRCTWNNTTNQTLHFGESANEEMCFIWAYYYPTQGYRLCADGIFALLCQSDG